MLDVLRPFEYEHEHHFIEHEHEGSQKDVGKDEVAKPRGQSYGKPTPAGRLSGYFCLGRGTREPEPLVDRLR